MTGDGLLEANEGVSLQIFSSNCLMKCSQAHIIENKPIIPIQIASNEMMLFVNF